MSLIHNKFNIVKTKISFASGQSIVEIVVALGIFAILAGTVVSTILGGLTMNERSEQYLRAGAFAQEGIEAVKAIRNRDWDELVYSRSAVTASSGQWELIGEGTTETIDGFTRAIDFMPIYRNSSGELVSAGDPDAMLDDNSRQVVVTITWTPSTGTGGTLSYISYLTNWKQ